MYLALTRSVLRPWAPTDRAALLRYANSFAVASKLRDHFPHPYTDADVDRFFSLCESAIHGQQIHYSAITIYGEAVGGIGLTLHDDIDRVAAELGYWLGEPFWGRGIVTEAAYALTNWAFATLPLTRVYALPFSNNPASARVLEKAGFVLEGRLRRSIIKNGEVLDQLMYARVQ